MKTTSTSASPVASTTIQSVRTKILSESSHGRRNDWLLHPQSSTNYFRAGSLLREVLFPLPRKGPLATSGVSDIIFQKSFFDVLLMLIRNDTLHSSRLARLTADRLTGHSLFFDTRPLNMDDVLFEFLHMETVHAIIGSPNHVALTPEQEQAAVTKLEQIGFSTGYKFVLKLTRDWPRFKDELDCVKFICKEFWASIFKKQVDNLRTNHQGVYVLQDNRFRFLTQVASDTKETYLLPRYIVFACGLIRGALANLGLTVVVTAEVTSPPSTKFQVTVLPKQE